jgi:hypothetical protein
MADDFGGLIGGVIAIFIAIVLIYAFYPVISQIGGLWYGVLFVVLAIALIGAAIIGLAGNR